MLTNGQKKALHAAAREARVPEEFRRTIQRRIGGFHSAADRTATRQGFIAVMAFYERIDGGKLTGFTPDYWRAEDAKAAPEDTLLFAVRRQARLMGWTEAELNRFLASAHVTGGELTEIATAPVYWLTRVLEALKAIARRKPQ